MKNWDYSQIFSAVFTSVTDADGNEKGDVLKQTKKANENKRSEMKVKAKSEKKSVFWMEKFDGLLMWLDTVVPCVLKT